MFFFHQKQSKRRRRICEKIEVHLSSARWNVGKSSTISLGDACKLQGPWKFEGLGRQTHASTWGGRAETTLPQWICLWWLFPWIFGRAGQRTCAHTHTHTESILQNLRGKTDLPYFQESKKHVALLQPSPTSLSYFFTRSCPWEIEKRKGLCSQAVEILNLELELIFHPASTNKIHQKAMLARMECSVFWGV